MSFISIEFLLFVAGIVTIYYFIPHRFRWALLLLAGYLFYASLSIQFLPLLLTSTALTYVTGSIIEKQQTKQRKKYVMFAGISLLLFFMGWFKYFNFVNESLRTMATIFGLTYTVPYQDLVLPLAISFYSFQAISYLADIYFGKQKPERHYGYFSVYFAFFPQLVAGPIEKARKLIPQFKVEQTFDYDNITYGMKRIAWGIFKKTLIADRLAPIVSSVYDNPNATGSEIVVATILFSIQLFADFSAVSDIAIGCARLFGIKLTENFKQPHFAVSIADFWNRWHITLSNWLRDYIFIPLCKGKKKRSEIYFAIIITFLVSGIWHGAAWTFVLWGLIHGFYRVFGDATKHVREQIATTVGISKRPTIHTCWKIAVTFLLVCFSRVFFRSNSVAEALEHARLFLTPTSWNPIDILATFQLFSLIDFVLFAFFFVVFQVFQYMERKHRCTWNWLSQLPVFSRFAFYSFVVLSIVIYGVSENGFIYGGF